MVLKYRITFRKNTIIFILQYHICMKSGIEFRIVAVSMTPFQKHMNPFQKVLMNPFQRDLVLTLL
jgi:hypothetical protein